MALCCVEILDLPLLRGASIRIYLPHIINYSRAFWYAITHVNVILNCCVRYAKEDSRHPPQALLDAAADVRQVLVVIDSGEAITANHAIDLLLCLSLHLWPDENGLYETIKSSCRCV